MPTVHRRTEPKTVRYFLEPLSPEVDLKMMEIPAGEFDMGSPDEEEDRTKNEGPVHRVQVPRFWLGKYPVTQAQWRVVASWEQVERELDTDPARFKGADRPVAQVSWHDAVEFCARLAQRTGRDYRLPSEAEWEYACRAETTTPFSFGDRITTEVANYDGNYTYGDGPKGEYRGKITPVGSLNAPNAFGLSDMHGNVWEWCADPWHENYEGAPTDGSVWQSENNNSFVLRGGSWVSYPWFCRSASRRHFDPGYRNIHLGFRLACSARGSSPL